MAKIARWKPNTEVDAQYPYWTRLNEAGEIVYSVPLEAPNDIPVDADDDEADKREYSYLPLLGGKNLRVYCWETTDKEWAYRVRGMINTQHSQERRFAEHFTVVPEVLGDGLDDGNRKVSQKSSEEPEEDDEQPVEEQEAPAKDRGKQNGYQQFGWPDVEKQALDRIEIQAIRELVKSTNPRYWEVFYQIKMYGEDAKAVADRMGVSVQRVHQLMNKVTEIAKNYRKENQ